ncbi:hypothetical protein AALO_G00097230 [Alosa alosa]|uniref:Uncharacterized protein n=1 Tax=Alosa alosa TaxID=278164 RepID=A0AAV6GWL2_9TELE|nr:hypothetical protein AALO_G00097230 [Alosa alosa]
MIRVGLPKACAVVCIVIALVGVLPTCIGSVEVSKTSSNSTVGLLLPNEATGEENGSEDEVSSYRHPRSASSVEYAKREAAFKNYMLRTQSSEAVPEDPEVLCGKNSINVRIRSDDAENLHVYAPNGSPLTLKELPVYCNIISKTLNRDVVLVSLIDGCFVKPQGSAYVLNLMWFGRPIQVTCPREEPPLIICKTHSMEVLFCGEELDKTLSINVKGRWIPLQYALALCQFELDTTPKMLSFSTPYIGCGMTHENGFHNLSIRSEEMNMSLSCADNGYADPLSKIPTIPEQLTSQLPKQPQVQRGPQSVEQFHQQVPQQVPQPSQVQQLPQYTQVLQEIFQEQSEVQKIPQQVPQQPQVQQGHQEILQQQSEVQEVPKQVPQKPQVQQWPQQPQVQQWPQPSLVQQLPQQPLVQQLPQQPQVQQLPQQPQVQQLPQQPQVQQLPQQPQAQQVPKQTQAQQVPQQILQQQSEVQQVPQQVPQQSQVQQVSQRNQFQQGLQEIDVKKHQIMQASQLHRPALQHFFKPQVQRVPQSIQELHQEVIQQLPQQSQVQQLPQQPQVQQLPQQPQVQQVPQQPQVQQVPQQPQVQQVPQQPQVQQVPQPPQVQQGDPPAPAQVQQVPQQPQVQQWPHQPQG